MSSPAPIPAPAAGSPFPLPFTARDRGAALAVILIWGMNFVATKLALVDFTPFQLGAARFLLTAFPLIFWVRPPAVGLRWLLLYSVFQGLGQFGLLFFSLRVGMTAALAAVLMQTQVFVTALLAMAVLGERIPRPQRVGLALAACGVVCFVIAAVAPGASKAVTLLGLCLNLLAASMWACSNIVVRRIQADGRAYSPLALVVWSGLLSGIAFVFVSHLFDEPALRWQWTGAPLSHWLAVLYVGWIANVLGYWLWTVLLSRHPANRVAPFSLAIPVVGLLAGIALLGEQVSAWQWAGAAFVMSALIFVLRSGHRRPVRR